jgi:Rps23 Pro-64 3,4-dihydroxylase Tpa1-like proline 4-hydroxylase
MINRFINPLYADPSELRATYRHNAPFPHIVMENFLLPDIADRLESEFPDLSQAPTEQREHFRNQSEVKFASLGVDLLSPGAFELVSFLNSEYFLRYLHELTGIEEPLLSDPYLSGGGYHQINRGGYLKIHADFNRHSKMNIDRRLNLLLYLNKDWDEDWGGDLQLFDEDMQGPVVRAHPHFNTCVIFSTTSRTFHGHPDPIDCPPDRSRRSLALYYFSVGRPAEEHSDRHTTLFRARPGVDEARPGAGWWLRQCVPPILLTARRRPRV